MQIRPLLPSPQALQCDEVTLGHESITIFVSSNLATSCCPLCGQPPDTSPAELATAEESKLFPKSTRAEEMRKVSRDRRLQSYQRVMELHHEKSPHREIARQLGIHRSTVRRFVQAGRFPEHAKRKYASATNPFVDYLRRRWQELKTYPVVQHGFLRASYSSLERGLSR